MSETERWLTARRPSVPEGLASRVRETLRSHESEGHPLDVLAAAARARLDAARSRPGRVRESAFELLLADALFTYACEAALEAEDPDSALLSLAEVASRS